MKKLDKRLCLEKMILYFKKDAGSSCNYQAKRKEKDIPCFFYTMPEFLEYNACENE